MTLELLISVFLLGALAGAAIGIEYATRVWHREIDKLVVHYEDRILKTERAASKLGVLLLEERAQVRPMPDGLRVVK